MNDTKLTELQLARDAVSNAAAEWVSIFVSGSGSEDEAVTRFDSALAAFEEAVRVDERSQTMLHSEN